MFVQLAYLRTGSNGRLANPYAFAMDYDLAVHTILHLKQLHNTQK